MLPVSRWGSGARFSVFGDGAAVRAASITWFLWLGLLAWRLLRLASSARGGVDTNPQPV